MHVRLRWKIELIQVLCSAEWRTAVFIPGQEIDTNTVCGYWVWFYIPRSWSVVFLLLILWSCCARVWQDRQRKGLWALGRDVWGHEGLQLGHIPALHTWLKVIPPGLRWAQISVCQKCNWRNLKIHLSRWGQIASPCPAMWGPLTERMNTIEGLFLPEQAEGRPDDKRPLDSRKGRRRSRKGHEKETESVVILWNTGTKATFISHINVKQWNLLSKFLISILRSTYKVYQGQTNR